MNPNTDTVTDSKVSDPSLLKRKSSEDHSKDPSKYQAQERPGTEATMLNAVKDIAISVIRRPQVSTYVPSAHMLMYVLHSMDDTLLTNKFWSPRIPRWSPLHSRLYYGILFLVQIFRCMIASGIANPEIREFMRVFQEAFDFTLLPIAGPLAIFFKALCVCATPYLEYGHVSPAVPFYPECSVEDNGMLPEHLRVLLPNLTALRRGIHTMRRPLVSRSAVPWNRNLNNSAGAASPIGPSNTHPICRDARITPGTVNDISYASYQGIKYSEEPSPIRIPNVGSDEAAETWAEFLGLDGDLTWFSDLAQQMLLHAALFKGSTNLNSISSDNGSSGLVLCTSYAYYPNRNDHRESDSDPMSFRVIATSQTAELPPPSGVTALLTQLNWKPALNFCPTRDDVGDVGVTRFGPWWSVGVDRVRTIDADPSTNIPQLIVSEFALDKPAH